MESKKLQQMQQANAHMAPQAKLYQQQQQHNHNVHEYRPVQQQSPTVFHNHPQYQSLSSNFAQVAMAAGQRGAPQLHVKPLNYIPGDGATREQLYQNNLRERLHQQQLVRQQPMPNSPPNPNYPPQQQPQQQHPHQLTSGNHNPTTELQHQYKQLQQAKMQAQIKTQNDAFIQQQRTFALRQQINPPVPNAYLMQSQQSLNHIPMHVQGQMPLSPQHQQQQNNRTVPPSSLNLTNQFQPAAGPLTISNDPMNSQYGTTGQTIMQQQGNLLQNKQLQNQAIYQQNQQIQQLLQQQHYHQQHHLQQQLQKTPDQIIIQQNHPGLVTNQACQTQISGQVHKSKQSLPQQQSLTSSDSTPSSPSHPPLERKKTSGSIALKSPVTKRPLNAPITLSGWLYKQGSDGLKVWRKRWFVLSEFCLYYYKGPEEDKLLGSILLPSYRVGACTPDDKIYRKFAFKCEHLNMRTYWLAAETSESMGQWVRALTAATLMQGSSESDQMSQPSISSLNQSGENSDSGIHTYQSQQSKLSAMPSSAGSGTTPASASDNGNLPPNGPQPLYANAPPKPRRVNDGGYSSPSPENSMDRYEGTYETRAMEATMQQAQRTEVKSPVPPGNDPLYEVRCELAKSSDPVLAARMQQQLRLDHNKSPSLPQVRSPYPNDIPYNNPPSEEIYQVRPNRPDLMGMGSTENILRPNNYNPINQLDPMERELYLQKMAQQKYLNQTSSLYPNDRRTPDTYGRSRSAAQQISSLRPQERKQFSDYEDIYNLEQQNAEIAGYRRPMSPNSGQSYPNYLEPTAAQHVKMRARPAQTMVPRPHSADFLEFDARNGGDQGPMPVVKPQAPRPKSSLDINRTPDYFYSEASYAEKLRQSSLFQQKPATMPIARHPQMPYSGDYQQDMIDYERNFYNEMASPGGAQRSQSRGSFVNNSQEQFLRSASARLPRREGDDQRSGPMTGRDSERKREESMKRLLEWKQRMLQSPLTRKGVGSMGLTTVQTRPKSSVNLPQGGGVLQRSRSETNANVGYNSYSSDDEDGLKYKSSAGRSTPTCPRTRSPKQTIQSISSPPSNSVNNSTSNSFLDSASQASTARSTVEVIKKMAFSNDDDCIASSEIIEPETDFKIIPKPSIEKIEPIPQYTPVYEHKTATRVDLPDLKPLPSPNSINIVITDHPDELVDPPEASDEYTDDDLDEALLEDNPEPSKEPETPTTEVNKIDLISSENHYMPMTPKKLISRENSDIFSETEEVPCEFSPTKTTFHEEENHEENHYVEMTQGKMLSLLADDFKSNYEMICISGEKQPEPVYMELSHSQTGTETKLKKISPKAHNQRSNLPDILNPSNGMALEAHDSSDNDDDNNGTPLSGKTKKESEIGFSMKSRTRFSLSDTFRPASYYLGASAPLGECIESSDSEIVSPPPIPKSPPPMEDLTSTEEAFLAEHFDTIKRKEKKDHLTHSFDEIPKLSNSDLTLHKTEGHKSSRLSLPDQLYKYGTGKKKLDLTPSEYISLSTYSVENKMYTASVTSCTTDNDSNTSSDYDLYNKLKMESPSYISDSVYNSNRSLPIGGSRTASGTVSEAESGDNLELRHSDSETERKNKRRPLSEDSLCEMVLKESSFEETMANNDLDQYLGKLSGTNYDYTEPVDQTNWIHESLAKIGEIHYIQPPEVFRTENDSFYENLTMIAQQQQQKRLFQEQNLPDISDENVVTLKEQNLSLHNAKCESEDIKSGYSVNLTNVEDLDQQSINCTAPIHSRGNSNLSESSAPYYYSDLPSSRSMEALNENKLLNNQRDVEKKKQGISHIHNPIHQVVDEARSIASDLLIPKDTLIDTRNLYETDMEKLDKNASKESTLMRKSKKESPPKCTNLISSQSNKNSPNHNINNLLNTSLTAQHSTSSLSRMPVISPGQSRVKTNNLITSQHAIGVENILYNAPSPLHPPDGSAGDQLWEEDTLWRERLRRVSHRHARSMDELDKIPSPQSVEEANSSSQKSPIKTRLSREVKYVNESPENKTNSLRKKVFRKKASDKKSKSTINLTQRSGNRSESDEEVDEKGKDGRKEENDNDVYVQLAIDNSGADLYETLVMEDIRAKKSFELDREKIRQWDSMSSGLMKVASNGTGSELDGSLSRRRSANAGGEGSLTGRTKAVIGNRRLGFSIASISVRNDGYHHQHQNSGQNHQPQHIIKNNDTYSVVNKNNAANINNSNNSHSSVNQQYHHPIRKASSHRDIDHIERETVSAIRNQIRTSEGAARQEHINRLDSLKQQLVDLERQYEKGKPLVNLVDNMVKLGSLYKSGSKGSNLALNEKPLADNNASDRLEFNQRVQEQRMLEEERRNWDRLSPNHNELQSKVQQLYQLDQLLQEESGTLQSLQRDKENLERALGGLRARLQTGSGPPMAIEAARKQQHALERELSRVHQLLAENSKKLEQTVAGNARLEQELLVLRQKLQASRGSKGSLNGLASSGGGQGGAPDSVSYAGSASAVLESDVAELRRVQQLVGDMQRQRQELSQAVRQLTENSDSLYQQIKPTDQYQPSHIKKRTHSTSWMETDLDTLSSTSHSDYIKSPELSTTKPLFVDTGSTDQMKMSQYQRAQMEQESSGVESSDDLLEGPNFQGLSYQEKQEIKTVRIVKRESERRQRDRERTNSTSQNLDQVQEEEYFVDDFRDLQQNRPYLDTFEQFNQIKAPSKNTNPFLDTSPYSYQPPPSMNQQNNENYYSGQMLDANYVNYDYQRAQSGLKSKTESIQSLTKTIGDLSPVFQSEAARQIIYEMSGNTSEDNSDGKMPLSNKHRRAVPKEKRRHNTAPNNVMSKSVQPAQSENDMNKPNTNWRARDDLDMEVALRPRINAPDVVRSALGGGGNRDKVSENAIDKLFAAPSKIVIPERYIPEQLPELSPEEKKKRQEKVEAIKKMLSEAPINASNDNGPPSGQISAEKKQREHLLQLNQILAQQVMQMSKIVAEKAMAALPSKVAEFTENASFEDDDPADPLPIYQQRDNFFT